MSQKKSKPLMPEIVSPDTPDARGREKARKILHLVDNIDELTADDLLQHIFTLAKEVQDEDPKNAITFKVAIDTLQYLYKEIQGRPPRRPNEKDNSAAFFEEWGIK